MASVAHLLNDAEDILSEIESRFQSTQESVLENFISARFIQKIFRGYCTRKHIAMLNEKATCIQKNWRAFHSRNIARVMWKEKFEKMCMSFYNSMATTIQKHWRSTMVRGKSFSFSGLKGWLDFTTQQNKLLKSVVEATLNKNNVVEMKQREEEAKEWIVYILFKLHHLLRTHQLSGIYSLPNTVELSEIEKMLKCLKYSDFMTFYNAYKEDVRLAKVKELPNYIFQGCKYLGHYEKEYHEQKKPHKDYLFSRGSYKNVHAPIKDIELRMQVISKEEENQNVLICHNCMYEINERKSLNWN